MVFGQVVIGPPGSGKTTYCVGMRQYLEALGRKVAVVNLDPANENYTYPVAANIHELIGLEAAAAHCELGPNGALVYCFEYLEANLDWLVAKLAALADSYVLIDMPGQVPDPHHPNPNPRNPPNSNRSNRNHPNPSPSPSPSPNPNPGRSSCTP